MTLFKIPVHSKTRAKNEGKIIFVSDAHFDDFESVASYSSAERHDFLIKTLIEEYRRDVSFDAVVFVGDTVSTNKALLQYREETKRSDFNENEAGAYVQTWINAYMSRLTKEGIPCFYINASHDSLYENEFENLFGYENNFVLESGDIAYVCIDAYSGPRNCITLETTPADISDEFLSDALTYLENDNIREAFVVSHYPEAWKNTLKLYAHPKVRAALSGHTHLNTVDCFADKPLLQTGHFSRGYTRMITHGQGFKAFAPLNDSAVGITLDEDGKECRDYSGSGSPWQWRVMQSTPLGVESYMTFSEISYKAFRCDGVDFPAFLQPQIEARPSFFNSSTPIDRSYIFFRKKDS